MSEAETLKEIKELTDNWVKNTCIICGKQMTYKEEKLECSKCTERSFRWDVNYDYMRAIAQLTGSLHWITGTTQ